MNVVNINFFIHLLFNAIIINATYTCMHAIFLVLYICACKEILF